MVSFYCINIDDTDKNLLTVVDASNGSSDIIDKQQTDYEAKIELLQIFGVFVWGLFEGDSWKSGCTVRVGAANYPLIFLYIGGSGEFGKYKLVDYWGNDLYFYEGRLKYLLEHGVVVEGLCLRDDKLVCYEVQQKVLALYELRNVFSWKLAPGRCLIYPATSYVVRLSTYASELLEDSVQLKGSNVTFILDGGLNSLSPYFINKKKRGYHDCRFKFLVESSTKLEVVKSAEKCLRLRNCVGLKHIAVGEVILFNNCRVI